MKRERRFLAALDDEGNMTEMGDKMAVRKDAVFEMPFIYL